MRFNRLVAVRFYLKALDVGFYSEPNALFLDGLWIAANSSPPNGTRADIEFIGDGELCPRQARGYVLNRSLNNQPGWAIIFEWLSPEAKTLIESWGTKTSLLKS